MIADKLSRPGQTIQNGLFLQRSSVPDPLARAVDALSLPWEDLDPYTFPPVAILGKLLRSWVAQRAVVLGPSDHVQ